MIETLLKQLGFNEKEIIVYLTIQKAGKIAPLAIAKQTNLNRTTVYSIAKILVGRGVISEDLGGSTRYFVALPPQDLNQIAIKEKRELAQKEALIGKAVEELQTLQHGATYEIPKIVFIPESDINDYLYKQTPIWNASMKSRDNTWWGFQDDRFVKTYATWIDWYWKLESTPKDLELKIVSSEKQDPANRQRYPRRMIKFWDASQDFNAAMWAIGDYLVMIVDKQNPKYLIEIHDTILAQNMRGVFKGIWNTLA